MEEQTAEKPFDVVLIVLLMLLALTSDISDAVTVLIAAVPVVGQIAYFGNMLLISPIVWALIQGTFVMKLGLFGRAGVINMAGGIANFFGIPGTTITTGIAIFVANHPRLAAVAETVGAVAATGGAAAPATAGAAGAAGGAAAGKAAAGAGAVAGETAAGAGAAAEEKVGGAQAARAPMAEEEAARPPTPEEGAPPKETAGEKR